MSRESTRRAFLASVGVAASVALAGCGSDNSGSSSETTDVWYYAETNKQLSQEIVAQLRSVNRDRPVRKGGNDVDAIRRLNAGLASYAVVGGDAASFIKQKAGFKAVNEIPDTELDNMGNVKGMMSLYPMPVALAARPDIGVDTAGELTDARVNVGPPESRLAATATQILPETNAEYEQVTIGTSEALSQVQRGELDATFVIGDWPNPAIQQVTPDIEILELSRQAQAPIVAKNEWLVQTQLPAGVYEGVGYMVPTVGIMAVLLTGGHVGSSDTAVVANEIVENDEITTRSSYLPSRDNDRLPRRVRNGLSIELHDGAQDELVFKEVDS